MRNYLSRLCCIKELLAAGVILLGAFQGTTVLAQSVTMGSPLTATPNISVSCGGIPLIANVNGDYGFFASGAADCTWRQSGVFGVLSGDPRFSSVPGDGFITSVSVRSGPNPAPLRFVVFRQLGTGGFGPQSQCCFFQSETNEVQPLPNTITTFTTNIPVQRNTINGFQAIDLIGISARTGTGTLPLSLVGSTNNFAFTQFGSVNAGFFYPRIGSLPNDIGGGRREEGIPGIEVLMQWTWCPAGVRCAGGGGRSAVGPLVNSTVAQIARGRALIDFLCSGSDPCRGVAQLVGVGAAQAASVKAAVNPGFYGQRRFSIKPGAQKFVKIKLKRAAKKKLNIAGSLQAFLNIVPDSGEPQQLSVTLQK